MSGDLLPSGRYLELRARARVRRRELHNVVAAGHAGIYGLDLEYWIANEAYAAGRADATPAPAPVAAGDPAHAGAPAPVAAGKTR